jgi:hypothetical protein
LGHGHVPDTVFIDQILQSAFTARIAYRAIMMSIEHEQGQDFPAGLHNPGGMGLNVHTGIGWSRTSWQEFCDSFYFHHTDPAGFNWFRPAHMTQGGNGDVVLTGCLKNRLPWSERDFLSIEVKCLIHIMPRLCSVLER